MPFQLPPLPYAFDALAPHIDAKTMEIHHGKHHAAYVTNANNALEGTEWANKDAIEIIRSLAKIPDAKRGAVRNNAGGHVNHSMFWTLMAPKAGGEPRGAVGTTIARDFGSFASFKEQFAKAALGRFGSGWVWLGVSKDRKLCICSTPNQDNPLMDQGFVECACTPILGLDVWEHAYYLNYQNRRADYVTAWWNVVNWAQVEKNFTAATK